MTDIELKVILELHDKWLKDIDGGKCANLSDADLSDANYIKIIGSRHELQYCGGIVLIGCIKHTIGEWLDKYGVIGKENKYTQKEIREYGVYLNMIKDNFSHCAGRE